MAPLTLIEATELFRTSHHALRRGKEATAPNKIYELRPCGAVAPRVLGPARQRSLRPAHREVCLAGLASRFGRILAVRVTKQGLDIA